MKSEDLLNHIGAVDDRFIKELADEDNVVVLRKRRPYRKRRLAAVACLAVVVALAALLMGRGMRLDCGKMTLSGGLSQISFARNSVVMIDVNPSIRLEVNDRSIVVKAEALNDEASVVIEGLELEKRPCNEVLSDIVASLQEHDYITNLRNSVLVTVVNRDLTEAEAIRAAVVETIELLDENTEYDLSILSQVFQDVSEFAELAETHGFSEGRAALIKGVCRLYEHLDFDSLAEHSIQTINQMFEYIPVPDFVQRVGKAAAAVPESFREKLGLDELGGKDLVSFTCAIADFYDSLCAYYDETSVANEIGYVFDIVCAENDDGTKLWAVLAESLSDKVKTYCALINMGEKNLDWCSNAQFYEIVELIEKLAG
ncbi:MAG: hypothetical protein HUJ66_07085 [Oscillospiraceae bacterium]|nr:hypothetical protein [Oscillospiraceae bacterium]